MREDEERRAFKVVVWWNDGMYDIADRDLLPRDAVELVKLIVDRIKGRGRIVQRITIVDDGDFTNFEWTYGKGVTFPLVLGHGASNGDTIH